jgi:hypothetical protein
MENKEGTETHHTTTPDLSTMHNNSGDPASPWLAIHAQHATQTALSDTHTAARARTAPHCTQRHTHCGTGTYGPTLHSAAHALRHGHVRPWPQHTIHTALSDTRTAARARTAMAPSWHRGGGQGQGQTGQHDGKVRGVTRGAAADPGVGQHLL